VPNVTHEVNLLSCLSDPLTRRRPTRARTSDITETGEIYEITISSLTVTRREVEKTAKNQKITPRSGYSVSSPIGPPRLGGLLARLSRLRLTSRRGRTAQSGELSSWA
jgi:hypothetical protein